MVAGQIGVWFSTKALNARQHDLDTLSAVCKWEPMKPSGRCFILGFCSDVVSGSNVRTEDIGHNSRHGLRSVGCGRSKRGSGNS
jgi:hypothetical protein